MTPLTEQERSTHAALVAHGDLDARIAATVPDPAAWLAYRADWKRGAVKRPFPLQLDFTLNYSCNLRCPMCTWSDPDAVQGGRSTWMTLALFKHILAEAVPKGLKAVGLNGINEPLMRRDLPDFVAAAREAGVLDIMLHTNGLLLIPAMARGLIEAGLTRLLVSVDAVTQATYDQIRVGGSLALVERNVDLFLEARGTGPLPVLGLCFVRMAVNAHEEAAFVDHWATRADFFAIQSYLNPWAGRDDKAALAAPGWTPPEGFVCAQPFMRMRLAHGGEVRPCCSFPGERITVGDAHRTSIEAIWHGTAMRDLRALHAANRGHEHPVCRDCMRNSYTQEAP